MITFLANLLPSPKFSWSVKNFSGHYKVTGISVLFCSMLTRAVDINRHACLCSSWTLQKNSVTAYDVVAMDLV